MEIPGLCTQAIKYQYKPNRLTYNGKESQSKEFADTTGLNWDDYGARMYDPQIGRWFSADPSTEMTYNFSPYTYALNNPINLIDPDGRLSTHTDSSGNVLAVYNDGDLGVYKHFLDLRLGMAK